MIWRKMIFIIGCLMAGFGGMTVTAWWKEPFPVKVHHRYLLTPEVAPGGDMQVGLDLYRENNCPMTVQRKLTYSDGSPTPMTQEIDKNFGNSGQDQYVQRVPIASSAPFGPASMWSRACARCNPINYIHPLLEICSSPTTIEFTVGPQTVLKEAPISFRPRSHVSADPRN